MKQISNCPNCETKNIRILHGYENNGTLAKCKSCGLIFATLLPEVETTQSIYDNYGRKDYLSEITIKRYNELLDVFEKYRKTNKILDVGCGIGYFLEVAKKRDWQVYGTEFSDKAVEICKQKGILMHKGGFDTAPYTEEEFDIITSFEVIEHVSNPKDIMSFVKFLRKNGCFYLTTPNFNSINRRWQKTDWGSLSKIAHLEHLSYYTKQSAKKILYKYNLDAKVIYTHGLSITRIKNYKNKKQGKEKEKLISATSTDEKLRVSIEKSLWKKVAKRIINAGLTLFGCGDSLKILAEKQ